jgi:hypothetical protein
MFDAAGGPEGAVPVVVVVVVLDDDAALPIAAPPTAIAATTTTLAAVFLRLWNMVFLSVGDTTNVVLRPEQALRKTWERATS